MQTKYWKIEETFSKPVSCEKIYLVEKKVKTPERIDQLVKEKWKRQLESKRNDLTSLGIKTEIRPYLINGSPSGLDALYENGIMKMWPGPMISLEGINQKEDVVELEVCQTSFLLNAALKDKKIKDIYREEGIRIPTPSFAICTFALTNDGYLLLTKRGQRTNVYPGRFYGQGGNPELTNTNVIDHQISELEDEVLIREGDYNRNDFQFGGIVRDLEGFVGKPDLVGWIPVDLSKAEIEERFYSRPVEERESDAEEIAFIKSEGESLRKFLLEETEESDYCPPAYGGLVLYGIHQFGKGWAETIVNNLTY